MLNILNLNSDDERVFSLKKKAFTLIELLVVIAIIGLLLAIIIPSLNMAKRKAASAVCLTNVKNLSMAWYMYQEDYEGRVVQPNTSDEGWVGAPERENGVECLDNSTDPPVTDADEIRGIEKGLLFPYVKSYDVFHCPADNQRKSKYDYSKIFRTYSIPRCLRGIRFNQITSPSMRFNFVEEAEGRNFNVGTWDFYTPYNTGQEDYWEWRDPIGVNHGDSGVLGFCDGHAEVHRWQDPHTKLRVKYYFEDLSIWGYGTLNEKYPRPWDQVDDIEYVARGWAIQSDR